MADASLDQLVKSASTRLLEWCGAKAQWIVVAPGRVNLIGEHVDYNGGFVLPMAIERYCVIAAAPNELGRAIVHSVASNDNAVISLPPNTIPSVTGHWSNYVMGAIAGCMTRSLTPGGFHAVIESSVPLGGGLSSSAAIEVATATLMEAMTGRSLDPLQKAILCQAAEHQYAGVPCGIMDQFASALSRANHLMLLDCRSQQVEYIPFSDPNVTLLIINTNVKHELCGGEYAQRRGQCESAARTLGVKSLRDVSLDELNSSRGQLDPVEFRRARHAVTEIQRTVDAAAAIRAGDWPKVGQLMYASHESLRDDFEVSCAELNLLVDLARRLGAEGGIFGARMTGGGFGGCTVSLVESARAASISQWLSAEYQAATGIDPAVITSRPARARISCKADSPAILAGRL